jgi:hypothetical protein
VNIKIRVKRRVAEDLLSSVIGGTLVAAVSRRSWPLAVLGILVGIALLIEEKADEEEEEG